jgi:hypothetical protein
LCFEGVIANWGTQDPGAVLGKLHVIRETHLHEVIFGELKGGGKDATLVTPQLTLKVLAVEVSPAAVGLKHSDRLTNQMRLPGGLRILLVVGRGIGGWRGKRGSFQGSTLVYSQPNS